MLGAFFPPAEQLKKVPAKQTVRAARRKEAQTAKPSAPCGLRYALVLPPRRKKYALPEKGSAYSLRAKKERRVVSGSPLISICQSAQKPTSLLL